MDVRDFSTWVREAKRRALERRRDLYEAALLPNQKDIGAAVNGLEMEMYALDNEDRIEMVEAMARKRLQEIKAKRRAKAERMKRRTK